MGSDQMREVRTSWSHLFPINKSAAHQDLPGFARKHPGTHTVGCASTAHLRHGTLPLAAARELFLGHGQAPRGCSKEQLKILDLFAPSKPSTPGSPSCERADGHFPLLCCHSLAWVGFGTALSVLRGRAEWKSSDWDGCSDVVCHCWAGGWDIPPCTR